MEEYYKQQQNQNYTSQYSHFSLPKEVSEYELGIGVLGQANTYTREIKILNTLKGKKKRKVLEHEQEHLRDPSLPEGLVRDKTQTWRI